MSSLNSIITLITEDIVFYTVFGILFYVDSIDKRKNGYSVEQKSATLKYKMGHYKTCINHVYS